MENLEDKKPFGRKIISRRSQKQLIFFAYEDYLWSSNEQPENIWDPEYNWFKENDYDYWDDLDIYEEYIEEYYKSKESGLDPGYSLL